MTTTDTPDEELDPFERSRRAMGLTVVENPYPEFVAQRAEHGDLMVEDLSSLMGEDTPAGTLIVYTALSYDAVFEVLRDGRRFSSSGYAEVMEPVMGRTILQMDAPEHHAYRGLISQAFTRKAMQAWETELIRPVVDRAIDAFAGAGRAELVRQLTFPFPVNVIAELLGLPGEQLGLFHRLAVELISVETDMDAASRASAALAEVLGPLIDERRASLGRDLVSVLIRADNDGQHLTDDEILAFCRLLLPAGAETTYRSLSNLLVGLLTNPEQLDAVRNDRSLIPQAIDEGLRWECPLLTIFRTATEDTEVCGVPVPAGAAVVLNLGSANHDERRWEQPERFDIFRPALPSLAFASGPHTCLGMHLARAETRVALERLFDRLPGLRLDPEAEPPVITGRTFRSPIEIPVLFG
jgi:cytochrome P450